MKRTSRKRLVEAINAMVRCYDRSKDHPQDFAVQFGAHMEDLRAMVRYENIEPSDTLADPESDKGDAEGGAAVRRLIQRLVNYAETRAALETGRIGNSSTVQTKGKLRKRKATCQS